MKRYLLLFVVMMAAAASHSLSAKDQPASLDAQLFDSLDDELFSGLDEPIDAPIKPQRSDPDDRDRASNALSSDADGDQQVQRQIGGEDIGTRSAENVLSRIGESMRDVQQRISRANMAHETQNVQRKIVTDLDKMLQQLQKQCQASRAGQKQNSSQPQQSGQPAGQASASGPTRNSAARLGQTEDSESIEGEDQRRLLDRAWGNLPASVRERIQSSAPERFLPKYSKLIEDYFRRLAEDRP